MSVTPKKHDPYGNYAHSLYYKDFCRFCRQYEPNWTAHDQNVAWEIWVKEVE